MSFPVAAYCRVSTDEQVEQGISIPSQKSRALSYLHAQGWDLYDYYVDDGYSAKDLNRPDMQRLIADAAEGRFKAVVVVKLDRLSRSQRDVLSLLEDTFEKNGIGFKSVTEPFDTTTPFGKAAIGMMAVFAQLERETIVERVKDAKKEAARQGRHIGGPAPIGYQYVEGNKIPQVDELRAQMVRNIFQQYNAGESFESIASILNANKIPPPGVAELWRRTTVRQLVKNPFYAGYIVHRGKKYKGQHSPIITEEEWKAAQDRRQFRSMYKPGNQPGLLTGFIFCGECGDRMRRKTVYADWHNRHRNTQKITHYMCCSQDKKPDGGKKCNCGYKRAEILEDAVVDLLTGIQYDPSKLEEIASDMKKQLDTESQNKLLLTTVKERDNVKQKINKWYEAYEKNILTIEEFTERIKDLRGYRETLDKQITELETEVAAATEKQLSIDEIIETLANFKDYWEEATFNERRAILSEVIEAVKVFKDGHFELSYRLEHFSGVKIPGMEILARTASAKSALL